MPQTRTRLYRTLRHPRGMVLITATWIAIALAAVVLVLAREMMIESLMSRQHLDQAKADAAELGMEQFVQSVLEQEVTTPGYRNQTDWELRKIGDCYAWVLTYNPDDETVPMFGITDEAGKVDLSTASYDMLFMLPGMTEQIAYEILDWVDTDDDVSGSLEGAETPDYQSAGVPYRAKNAPFESVDELRLLIALQDPQQAELILHGADTNHNHVLDPDESSNADSGMAFSNSMVGIEPFVTAWGLRATPMPVGVTASSTTTTSGIQTTTSTTTKPDIADINFSSSSTVLTSVLTQYLGQARATTIVAAMASTAAGGGGRGGGGGGAQTTKQYKNLWDWAIQMQQGAQLTSTEFGEIYFYVTCSIPSSSNTTTTVSQISTNGTAPASQPTVPVGRININDAPKAVLMSLPSFEETDADNIIAYREANLQSTYESDPTQVPNIAWLMDQVDPQKLIDAGSYLTGASTVYSADIVTVSPDGRAFKRVKIIVDVTSGTPQIIYRRDLTREGWPLDPAVRDTLRKGGVPDRIGPAVTSSGGLTSGVR